MKFIIQDWAGNHMFPALTWNSFEDAEDHLCQFFEAEAMDYEEWRGEYEIVEARETPKIRFNYTQFMR